MSTLPRRKSFAHKNQNQLLVKSKPKACSKGTKTNKDNMGTTQSSQADRCSKADAKETASEGLRGLKSSSVTFKEEDTPPRLVGSFVSEHSSSLAFSDHFDLSHRSHDDLDCVVEEASVSDSESSSDEEEGE